MRFQWTLVLASILPAACGSTPVDIPPATSTASPFGPAELVDQRFDTAPPLSAATQGEPATVNRTASPPQPRWTRSNPGGGGAFASVGAGPTGIILAGSGLSGAYISSDFMQDVAISPANSDILYATSSSNTCCGGDPTNSHGVLRSIDGGASWTQVNEEMAWPFARPIAIDPNNPSLVWVGSPGTGFRWRIFDESP